MLICVDGTGPHNDGEYYKNMHNSFISMLYRHSTEHPNYYFRGPNWAGLHSVSCAEIASIIRFQFASGNNSIFLAGYSRGGAMMIETAHILKGYKLTVEAMFLFDAVDRSPLLSKTTLIPSNVNHAYHALRETDTRSRTSFGNCGTKAEKSGVLIPEYFPTTHAGMGGVPWVTNGLISAFGLYLSDAIHESPSLSLTKVDPASEGKGMRKVQHWMWDNLRRHGVAR
jgi:hypothetical protein